MDKLGPYELNKVHCVDALEALPLLPDGCVDAVVTDPPYRVGLDYGNSYIDARDGADKFFQVVIKHLRVVSRCVILTPGVVNLHKYPTPDGVMIRVDKTAQSPARFAWMNKWEPIFIYGKPSGQKPAWDIIETRCQVERRRIPIDHPCPKTLDLIMPLVVLATHGIVLDPFMGSGTTGVAAVQLGRRFLGFEINQEYCDIANKRIEAARCGLTVKELEAGQGTLFELEKP